MHAKYRLGSINIFLMFLDIDDCIFLGLVWSYSLMFWWRRLLQFFISFRGSTMWRFATKFIWCVVQRCNLMTKVWLMCCAIWIELHLFLWLLMLPFFEFNSLYCAHTSSCHHNIPILHDFNLNWCYVFSAFL